IPGPTPPPLRPVPGNHLGTSGNQGTTLRSSPVAADRVMSGGVPEIPVRLRIGPVSRMLGVSTRHVTRLVAQGHLASPEQTPGGRVWLQRDVVAARERRAHWRPSNRRYAIAGQAQGTPA